jgi:hypothetical protein
MKTVIIILATLIAIPLLKQIFWWIAAWITNDMQPNDDDYNEFEEIENEAYK